MRRLCLTVSDRQLTLRRDRRKDILSLAVTCAVAASLLALCFVRVPGKWHGPNSVLPLTMGLLSCAAFAWRLGLNLRRWEWVVDRATEQVLLNGHPVEAIGELESVCLDRNYYDRTGATVLYLNTRGRVSLEIARDGLFGVSVKEMWEAADALAGYAGLNLVTRDGFRPGRPASAEPSTEEAAGGERPHKPRRRLGGKRRMA